MNRVCDDSCNLDEVGSGLIYSIFLGAFKLIMLRFLHIITKHNAAQCFTRESLIDSVDKEIEKPYHLNAEHCANIEAYRSLFRELHKRQVPHTHKQPNFSVLSIYARLGLEDRVFEILRSDQGISAEARAVACEFLQVTMFDGIINRELSRRTGILPGQRLTYFRMAQQIRDIDGVPRPPRPGNCFNSLEDITEMERQIGEGDPSEFLAQCCLLGLVDNRHFDEMFASMKGHSQLVKFFVRAHPALEAFDGPFSKFDSWFCRRFESMRFVTPKWHETTLYLRVSSELSTVWHVENFGIESIPREALDIFLNYVLQYLSRCIRDERWALTDSLPNLRRGDATLDRRTALVIGNLKILLERGANLHYTAGRCSGAFPELAGAYPHIFEDEELRGAARSEFLSSLGLLLEISRKLPSFQLSAFMPYICCAMNKSSRPQGEDKGQPLRLICLAARACRSLGEHSRIPTSLIPWIATHREVARFQRTESEREERP